VAFILLANLLKNNAKKVWRVTFAFAIFMESPARCRSVMVAMFPFGFLTGFLVAPDRE